MVDATMQLTPNHWLMLGPSGIKINMQTGEVTIPDGLNLTDAAKEFWKMVGLVFPNKPGEFINR